MAISHAFMSGRVSSPLGHGVDRVADLGSVPISWRGAPRDLLFEFLVNLSDLVVGIGGLDRRAVLATRLRLRRSARIIGKL
jgi:hypothetical protein